MERAGCLALVLLGVSIALVAASASVGPQSFYSSADRSHTVSSLHGARKADGSYDGLRNTYYAVSSLQLLKEAVPESSKVCDYAKSASAETAEAIFYQASITESLGCGSTVSEKTNTALLSALKSDSLVDVQYGISAVLALLKNKHVNVPEKEVKEAIEKVLGFAEDDGVFKKSEDDSYVSTLYSGLALNALGGIASQVKSLSKDEKARLESALDNSASLISLADEEDDVLVFFVDEQVKGASSLQVTSSVFTGLNTLAAALGKSSALFKEDQLVGLAQFFVSHKEAATPEDIFYLVQGLQTSAKNQFGVPLVVSLDRKSVSSGAKGADGSVKVRVSDVLGNFATSATVTVLKVAQGTDVIITNQEATPVAKENTLYEFNLATVKPQAGFYTVQVRVVPKDKGFIGVEAAENSIKVLGGAQVTDFVFTVYEANDDVQEGQKFKVEQGKKFNSDISVGHNQRIHAEFKVVAQGTAKNLQVHQAAFRFTAANAELVVPAQRETGKYSVKINPQDLLQEVYNQNATFSVELIVGDSFLESSIDWTVGNVKVASPTGTAGNIPRSPFAVLPTIKHEFRQPEKRPAKTISFAFTCAVLAPIAVLLIGLLAVGANIRNFPTGGSFIFAVGFQGCLGAILLLFGYYWLQFDMISTLLYLGVLLVPFIFLGQKTLNAVAQSKLKQS